MDSAIPTAPDFWASLARDRAAAAGYTGEIRTTLPEGWKPEKPAPKKRQSGYGRQRWRCDADGEGFSVHHTGLGSTCSAHPDAMRHDWRQGSPMEVAERWIRDHFRVHPNDDIEAAITRYSPGEGYETSIGELAACWALFKGWGGMPIDGGLF